MAVAITPSRIRFLSVGFGAACLFSFVLSGLPALAQEAKPAPAAPKPIDPEELELVTKTDSVCLKATYYASTKGKEAIPVIILHDSKTDRHAYNSLALALQADGHAVLVPDLRGFGESTKIRLTGGRPDEEFSAQKMGNVGYSRMVTVDMEKFKSYFKELNNAGTINLNQLCLIGVGDLGCAVALNWTDGEWRFVSEIPKHISKESKDVRALILISPEPNYKNLSITKLLTPMAKFEDFDPTKPGARTSAQRLSFFFIAGGGKPGTLAKPKEWRNTSSYAESISRIHPKAEGADAIKADQTVFLGEMPTSLQGADLLSPAMLKTPVQIEGFNPVPLEAMIITFIDWRVREKADEFPWSKRYVR